ncbi:MAG: hypothetical protein KC777_03365 [Cyanobacteria bacterium HKST-UBA02]|nr:hypothetical protein [Cyanobacteria bacterium HKST-UBA02]
MTDAFSEVNSVVNDVHRNGGESGARMLMQHINEAREDFGKPGINKVSNGFDNYMKVVSDELVRSGVLPELSVGWAKENMDILGDGKKITDTHLKRFQHSADNSQNPVDQLLIRSLNDMAPDLKNASNDQPGRETVINMQDLDQRLAGYQDQRDYELPGGRGHDPNARRTQVLLEDGGKFFDYLDGIRNDGEQDGRVSRNDLVTFNERAKSDPGFARQFSPEQLDAVRELEQRWDDEGQSIHTGGIFTQFMTRESIAKGIGFQDIPAETIMQHTLNQDPQAHEAVPINPPQDNRRAIYDSEREVPINPPRDNSRAIRDSEGIGADKGTEPCDAPALPDRLMKDATQRVGEGPYQVAERLLPGASHKEIMELTRALKRDFQERTGDHSDRMITMKVGERFITPENLDRILSQSPALRRRMGIG